MCPPLSSLFLIRLRRRRFRSGVARLQQQGASAIWEDAHDSPLNLAYGNLEGLRLIGEEPSSEDLLNGQQEMGPIEGLRDEEAGPPPHRLHGRFHAAERRYNDDRQAGNHRVDPAHQFEPGDARHPDIGDDEVELFEGKTREGLLTVGSGGDVVSRSPQVEQGDFPPCRVVLDVKNTSPHRIFPPPPVRSATVKAIRGIPPASPAPAAEEKWRNPPGSA